MFLHSGLKLLYLILLGEIIMSIEGQTYARIGENLTNMPGNIPMSVENIHLDQNIITSIGSGAFSAFASLDVASLAQNHISSIHVNAFVFSSIRDLDISCNDIASFPDLRNVNPTLRTLRLDDNDIQNIPCSILRDMDMLKELYIIGNKLTTLPGCSSSTLALQKLDMGSNLITTAGGNLNGMSSLEFLNMSHTELTNNYLDLLAPRLPATLTQLLLNNNDLLYTFTSSSPAWGTTILEILQANDNYIPVMPRFPSTIEAHLEVLQLSHNNIQSLPEFYIDDFPKLSSLFLNNNEISHLPRLCSEAGPVPLLKVLSVATNDITTIHTEAFNGLRKLKNLNLRANGITDDVMAGVDWTELTSMALFNFFDNDLANLPDISAIKMSLRYVFTKQ